MPPLVTVAVNTTLAPAHIAVLAVLMAMVGVAFEPTVMVILLEVAVACVTQLALLVNTTVTTSPLAKVVVVNVALLVPWLLPFTFHW